MKQLHLYQTHKSLGAQLIKFAGWGMPLRYSSVVDEHLAVREAAGLFDVSHMGEFSVRGAGAIDFLQSVTSNDVSKLAIGGVQYSTILNERGGIKDDVLIHRIGQKEFIVVCNAVNVEKLNGWFKQHLSGKTVVKDISLTTVMLAIQGPKSQNILQPLTELDLAQLKRYRATETRVAGIRALVSRSGYTGEDGFELFIFDEPISKPIKAEKVWKTLLQTGKDAGIKPCGLGARDTTRLEAGLCLYGNELTENTTPLEARIDFVVKFEKGEFIGRGPLLEQKKNGPMHLRVGLRMLDGAVPRKDYEIFKEGEKVGIITSGTFSPLLKAGIAMGYIKPGLKIGEKISVEIRNKKFAAQVVNWPFYDPTRYGHTRR